MKEKSEVVKAVDRIQAAVHSFLKPQGFRKKGRVFNRQAKEDGIIQVIEFQSGPYEFGGKYDIPGFRENLYGRMTVNMGVVFEELYRMDEYNKPRDFYQEVYCQPRTRLPFLLYGKDDWWDLGGDHNAIADEIINGIKSAGFEYFELYQTRAKFCENFGKYADAPPRAKLDVALVVLHQDRKAGEELVREYFNKIDTGSGHTGHKNYVRELCTKLNIALDDG